MAVTRAGVARAKSALALPVVPLPGVSSGPLFDLPAVPELSRRLVHGFGQSEHTCDSENLLLTPRALGVPRPTSTTHRFQLFAANLSTCQSNGIVDSPLRGAGRLHGGRQRASRSLGAFRLGYCRSEIRDAFSDGCGLALCSRRSCPHPLADCMVLGRTTWRSFARPDPPTSCP